MAASQYMIGDIVRVGDCGTHKGEIATVRSIRSGCNYMTLFNTCEFEECEDDVFPVEITDRFLESNGFEVEKYYDMMEKDGERYERVLYNKSWRVIYSDSMLYLMNTDPTSNMYISAKYVHQMQQAMRLCGLNEIANNLKAE